MTPAVTKGAAYSPLGQRPTRNRTVRAAPVAIRATRRPPSGACDPPGPTRTISMRRSRTGVQRSSTAVSPGSRAPLAEGRLDGLVGGRVETGAGVNHTDDDARGRRAHRDQRARPVHAVHGGRRR